MRTVRFIFGFVVVLNLLPLLGTGRAQEQSVKPGVNKNFEDPDLDVDTWVERFEREGREIFDQREQILKACAIESGMSVADVGAGSGLFSQLFAKKVGPTGRVFAVDIAKKFVDSIESRCREAGLANVTGLVCSVDDAKLPANSVDVAFLCDTYHHFEFPSKTVASIHRALRPGGRLILIDFKRIEGESSDWILNHVRAGQEAVTKEIEACGFEFEGARDLLKDNYFVIFRRAGATAAWSPVQGQLLTRWAGDVSPDKAWPEYPRPQMVRKNWQNLNGLWDYAIRPQAEERPAAFDGEILVPFAVESALSGVKKTVGSDNRLWYRRQFSVPPDARDQRLLLHFGAVDWHARIWVNGEPVGEHKGGYDSFCMDITAAVSDGETQELLISVWDPTNGGFQPRGKQVVEPKGIWYTSVTGIWQTVWIEPVPETHIRSVKLTPDVDRGQLHVVVDVAGPATGTTLVAEVRAGDRAIAQASAEGTKLALDIPNARLWSPDDPFLYDVQLRLQRGDAAVDQVDSYFGMRKIELSKADDGFNRLFLNGQALFQFGPLDQGWWPDGLYTAPTDEALRYDLEVTKKLGFNMIRKHVKVEPARWYHHCDQLGLLVWQDMPNGDKHIGHNAPDLERTAESADNYRAEYKALIDGHYNCPCIVAWVPFNEGWGQFETDNILAWTKQHDPSRLVDAPSGWADRGTGDMHDIHRYPGPGMTEPEAQRAVVLGEFGGLGLPLAGHLWWDKRNWGYRTYASREELQSNYDLLIHKLRPMIGAGLAAAVYTQTTDVEGEVNGLMTYDRAVVKYDAERLAGLHHKLYLPPPIVIRRTVLPTSEESPQTWRFTMEQPGTGWQDPGFDDSGWQQGPAGFGRRDTPGTVVRTAWESNDIWLRQTFEVQTLELRGLRLRVHHDEDAEVFLNGKRLASLTGYTTRYDEIPLDEAADELLQSGTNTLAVHCRQTQGGQYIDVGLVDVEEKERTE